MECAGTKLQETKNRLHVNAETFETLAGYWREQRSNLNWQCLFVIPAWLTVWWNVFRPESEQCLLSVSEGSELIGVAPSDERVPDVIGIASIGTVYSTATKIKKIAEHGGDARQDRHVPIVVWGAGVHSLRVADPVETTQIAPTVLELLGLPARDLKAVQLEHTQSLPGVR